MWTGPDPEATFGPVDSNSGSVLLQVTLWPILLRNFKLAAKKLIKYTIWCFNTPGYSTAVFSLPGPKLLTGLWEPCGSVWGSDDPAGVQALEIMWRCFTLLKMGLKLEEPLEGSRGMEMAGSYQSNQQSHADSMQKEAGIWTHNPAVPPV